MRFKYFAALAAFAVSAPATSHAQLGGLVKKAREAAASKVETNVVGNKNVKPSSAFGPELTEATLDAVLRGLAAAEVQLVEADRLREERQKVDAEMAKSYEAHDKDREKYDESRRKAEDCQTDVIDKRREAAQRAFEARIQSNPAAAASVTQAAMAATQKISAAQQKGDSAEVRRLMLELGKAQGLDPVGDSLAAVKSCGAVPSKPAWLAAQESGRDRSMRLDRAARDAESGAHSSGAKASGMSAKDYGLARERVLHWYLEQRYKRPIQDFGPNERKLLESKGGAIEKYKRAL